MVDESLISLRKRLKASGQRFAMQSKDIVQSVFKNVLSIDLERRINAMDEHPACDETYRAYTKSQHSHRPIFEITMNLPLITNHKKEINTEYPRYSNPPVKELKLNIRAQ